MADELKVARTEYRLELKASRQKVWRALTSQISEWWPKSFCTAPARVKAFRAEIFPGGRLYEDWGGGNGLLWWNVNAVDAEAFQLTLQGTLGATGVDFVKFILNETESGTLLIVSDTVWGQGDPADVQAEHAEGWKMLFADTFKVFVERD